MTKNLPFSDLSADILGFSSHQNIPFILYMNLDSLPYEHNYVSFGYHSSENKSLDLSINEVKRLPTELHIENLDTSLTDIPNRDRTSLRCFRKYVQIPTIEWFILLLIVQNQRKNDSNFLLLKVQICKYSYVFPLAFPSIDNEYVLN